MCVWRLRATTNARRIRRAARPLAAPSGFARTLLRLCFAKLLASLVGGPDGFAAGASRAQATRRLRRGRISPLETVRRRRGLKVAIPVRFIFSFTVHRCAPFARRRRTVSTFGLRQMPATRKPPTRYTKAHKISRINELPPQKGIFRVISCRALGPCSCPADGAPAGAAVVTRLARHRLKPCRGDTAECCHKATRRSQGSWSRAAPPHRMSLHK